MLYPGFVGGGRYRLLSVLGAGGSGVAWRALDLRAQREVCVKAIPLEGGGAEAARLEEEACVRVRHPAVARVQEVLQAGEHALVVMELAEGSLQELVREVGPLSPEQALAAVEAPLQALAAAHAAGLVHRDVKPSNLLWFPDGAVRLSDWGAARLLVSGEGLTRTGALVGSIPFMAPEQRRDARAVGPATDVYGLAMTLGWLCLGEAPEEIYVPGANARLRERLPEELFRLLLRAGAFLPEERPSAAELLGELRGLGLERQALPKRERTRGRAEADSLSDGGKFGAGGYPTPSRPPLDGGLRGQGRSLAAPGAASPSGARSLPTLAAQGPFGPNRRRVPRNAPRALADGNAPRGWAVTGAVCALIAGVGAGGWAALRDDVRSRLVEEPEEVRRARELAAIPICADAPARWEQLNSPRDSTSPQGKREAGGGRIADIDRDGHPDVVYAHQLDEGFRIFWGDASGRLPHAGQDVVAPRMNMGTVDGVDVADLDSDGILDLLGTATEARGIVVTLGTGSRSFSPPQLLESGGVPYGVRAKDWDGDGILDLILRTQAATAPVLQWRRGLGGMVFDSTERLHVGGHAFEVADVLPDDGVELIVADAHDLRVYARTAEARVGLERARIPLPIADVRLLRVVSDGAVPSIFAASATFGDRATMLRIRLAPTLDVCAMPMPAAFVLDVGHLNDDDLMDMSALVTCSYCTTSYQAHYGVR